jgi:dephospho-CoA kinase
MPDAQKRRRADVVIRTGLSRHHSQRHLRRLVRQWRQQESEGQTA